ncbi:MAG: enoyl-[acyl-carrier protein] reductase III [Hyphomicrobiaceae bacterium]|jgi:enoyl-[acyl-carrier protein] reductase III
MSNTEREWVVILGASSGFGAAVARSLAAQGLGICGVHLDRRSTIAAAEETKAAIEEAGAPAIFFNVNACDEVKRGQVLDALADHCAPGRCRLLFHSLAFGSLLPLVGDQSKGSARPSHVSMTLDVMAHSLVYWTQELVWRGLLGSGGRVLAMSSAGSTRAMPGYGMVSAAKAALEAYVRQLAVELGPRGISANTIRAGVTDTAALRKIPGHEAMREMAQRVNPRSRLTTPQDIAGVVSLLVRPEADWINGDVIGVDGGEDIAAP